MLLIYISLYTIRVGNSLSKRDRNCNRCYELRNRRFGREFEKSRSKAERMQNQMSTKYLRKNLFTKIISPNLLVRKFPNIYRQRTCIPKKFTMFNSNSKENVRVNETNIRDLKFEKQRTICSST